MLNPVADTFDSQAASAGIEVSSARTSMLRFLGGAALAGAAVGTASILLLMLGAPLLAAQHPFARPVQAAGFGIALTIVVFAGATLSTSTVLGQGTAYLRRRVELADALLVWLAALIGNLVGSVVLALVVDAAGIFTAGAPANQPPVFQSALGAVAVGVGDLSGGQLLVRAILCNLLLSAAILMAARTASDGLRLAIVWAGAFVFVATGLEYSVATMTTLSLAALSDVGTWGDLSRNLTFTVPGNLIGGALFVLITHGAPAASTEPTKVVAKKAVAKKAVAKKAVAKKAVAKKAVAKKASARA